MRRKRAYTPKRIENRLLSFLAFQADLPGRRLTMSTVANPRKIKGLNRHSGEWVAINNDQVVAYADTLTSLREQVRARGQQVEGFFRVPPPRQGAGIFLQRHALHV